MWLRKLIILRFERVKHRPQPSNTAPQRRSSRLAGYPAGTMSATCSRQVGVGAFFKPLSGLKLVSSNRHYLVLPRANTGAMRGADDRRECRDVETHLPLRTLRALPPVGTACARGDARRVSLTPHQNRRFPSFCPMSCLTVS
jgi:hypothetical protein